LCAHSVPTFNLGMCEQSPRTTKPETTSINLHMYKSECCSAELRFNHLPGDAQCHVWGVFNRKKF